MFSCYAIFTGKKRNVAYLRSETRSSIGLKTARSECVHFALNNGECDGSFDSVDVTASVSFKRAHVKSMHGAERVNQASLNRWVISSIVRSAIVFGICGECYPDHETSGRFRAAASINRSLRRHLYKFFQSIMGAHKLNDLMVHDILIGESTV